MLIIISIQSNKKISVVELFTVTGKQKNTSLNNFRPQISVKNFF